jgi:hypothetical protein
MPRKRILIDLLHDPYVPDLRQTCGLSLIILYFSPIGRG